MSQENVELVRSAYEAYNRRDVDGVLGCFDPDIDWHVPDSLAWGDHVRGLEAIGRFFEGLKPYMGDDHQVAIDELIGAGHLGEVGEQRPGRVLGLAARDGRRDRQDRGSHRRSR